MQSLMVRTRYGLVAADEQAQDELAKIRIGTTVLTEYKRARNPRQHALMFATLNAMFENQREPAFYKTFPHFYLAVKDALGWYDEVSVRGGKATVKDYWSLQFANCPQEKFEPMLEQALDLAARVLDRSKDEMRRESELRAADLPLKGEREIMAG